MNPYKVGDYVKVRPRPSNRLYYGTVEEVSGDGLTILSNENVTIQLPHWYVQPAQKEKLMYCKIVKVETETSATGDERWVLTHACGRVERRMRRKRGRRTETKAPTKVKCGDAGA